MINATSGRLVLVDANTDQPKVFWDGKNIPVLRVTVAKPEVVLRIKAGSMQAELRAELEANGIEVKEVK